MIADIIESHIHFKHTESEVAQLNKAVIPMRECILAVSSNSERQNMRLILGCQYFRARAATSMVTMLTKAAKYAKAHLGDFFPVMRAQILDDALELEEAALDYKLKFIELRNVTLPTH